MFLDFLWGGKKWYKLTELDFWLVVIILAVFITLLALTNVLIVKCLKIYFLNKRLDKAVPKDFPTSFDVEKRYQNISYHCKILTELLNVNKKYTFCWFRMFSGGAYAYRDVLRARFTDLFDYLKEVIVSDYSKYKGFDLPSEEIYKIRTKLKKSFVNRYHKLRTYDALDTFAAYSDMLVGLLIDINNECEARCVKESHGAVQDMLNDIQTYYREYNRYKGIRKKVFTTQTIHYSGNTMTTTTYYHTMGHKRLHFMNLLKEYIVFIDNFYNHMQVFYEYDTINNPV